MALITCSDFGSFSALGKEICLLKSHFAAWDGSDGINYPQPFWLFFFSCTPGSVNQQVPMGKNLREMKWIQDVVVD